MSRRDPLAPQLLTAGQVVDDAPAQHVITIESLVSKSWVDDNGSPAAVIRWVCSCGRRGGEFWHTQTARARGAGVAHAHAATRRQRSAAGSPVAPPARRGTRRRAPISVARVGARYAMLAGVTLAEATWVMRAATGGWVTGHSLAREWSRLYPGVPARVSQRGRAPGEPSRLELLAPQPMASGEVAELVERTRENELAAAARGVSTSSRIARTLSRDGGGDSSLTTRSCRDA